MKIKVCGLKEPGNVGAVAELGPDYMGFIFYGPSPRYAGGLSIDSLNISGFITKTAVFVNESFDSINAILKKNNFGAVQLHGDESPEFCELFRDKVKVIKAFGMSADFDFSQLNRYSDHVNFFLFDTKTDLHGGSGKVFDWSVLEKYTLDVPFFLSGGLSLDNLEQVKNIVHPMFYGIDLNSKFEDSPGIKNIEKLEKAFEISNKILKDELPG